ncbi:AAA family ATPase [Caldinitratiruptor microaerophilus]|uniref:ATPase n=1 Tax=Caldinitratiruptor microaerophilus TaxID=671077 RepID=A0AA35G946_9FIRM|nr:MoxR family ATPase [Caldinitratiruptor microaerophilus]BDG61760.1 ATPase [Caldinitratiruptor microaerophilus]
MPVPALLLILLALLATALGLAARRGGWGVLVRREVENRQALAAARVQVREEGNRMLDLSPEQLQQVLREQGYFLDRLQTQRLWVYLRQGKPVGIRGEPGIGKSLLPEALAKGLGFGFIDMACHSHLEAEEIGISWNGFKQIVDAQAYRGSGPPPDLYTLEYLTPTPLLQSLLADRPTVVRVDEVDKLNEHTTNFFLRYLDRKELVVHNMSGGTRTLRASAPLYIFLTSNEYKKLDPAFMRRTVWLDLTFPDEGVLAEILRHGAGVPLDFAARVARIVHQVRQLNLEKKPSIAEALEWCRALVDVAGGQITPQSVDLTIGFLAKWPEDVAMVKEALRRWYDTFHKAG